MKILIVSATLKEIEPTLKTFDLKIQKNKNFYRKTLPSYEIFFLITGIGSYAFIYNTLLFISKNKVDFIVNVGIAGSFSQKIKIGDTVNVRQEQIADLSIDAPNGYFTLFDKNIISPSEPPFKNGFLINPIASNYMKNLQLVDSITTNTVSGTTNRIELMKKKFNASIENMEGAACFYVCLLQKIPFLEIRSISNYVEPRNRNAWKIDFAIKRLNTHLQMLIYDLISEDLPLSNE